MNTTFQVCGTNEAALFTLKLHRGDGMTLVAMNWKQGTPPEDFVGFAIEYKEPGGDRFFSLQNRLAFPDAHGKVNPNTQSTRLAPIQKFRWIHFPRNAELKGEFTYRVTPVFMDKSDQLSYGDPQEAPIVLQRETYPGKLNVAFTRGFVSSQAFVKNYGADAIPKLIPSNAAKGLTFVPTHPKAKEALAWMGFEARSAILEVLDQAIADQTAQVRFIAYDLNEPDIVKRLEQLKTRVKVIIDDSDDHGATGSAENAAAKLLEKTAGKTNVKRQHMGSLQHNKTIIVDGAQTQTVVCGSTNFSWRGFFVQNNNALVLHGKKTVQVFQAAFDAYWAHDDVAGFGATAAAKWNDLGLDGVSAQITFAPHTGKNVVLDDVAADMADNTKSSLFFSLAFLYQTPGALQNAIKKLAKDDIVFAYGISDHAVTGLQVLKSNGKIAVISPAELSKNLPEPFKAEPSGGSGVRMHHKFVVLDFDKPTARVYLGSFNFSTAADTKNGENLVLIRDRAVAVSYTVEALRLFDHYEFRVAQSDAKLARKALVLAKPPRKRGEKAWWNEDYTVVRKIRDRELFA